MLYPIITRTKQWWQPKAGNLLSAVYLAIFVFNITLSKGYLFILPSITTILGIGLFGYFFNDYSDLESDLKVNKRNMLQKLQPHQRLFLLIGALFLALTPWLFLPFDTVSIFLLVAEFSLLLAYAVPPIRLKERGILAVITDALYAYAIPFTLAFHTFQIVSNTSIDFIQYGSIFAWQFMVGIVNIFIHQLEDFENDLQTQTKTWVIDLGKSKSKKILFYFFFPLMILCFVSFTIQMSIQVWMYYFTLPLFVLIVKFIRLFSLKKYSRFVVSNSPSDLQEINVHFHYFMPYYHLGLLVFVHPAFFGLLLGHFLLFNFFGVYWLIKEVIYACFLKYWLVKMPSQLFNYSIYYFRIIILRETKQRARREFFEAYMNQQNEEFKKKNLPNVVLVSANDFKYTETFIALHEKTLIESGYYVHRFFGGYLPTHVQQKGHFISNNPTILKYYDWITTFFGFEKDHYLKKGIINYLKYNSIDLVIAEFGQSGAEMAALCEAAKIPLVVIFYGYDAHHQLVNTHFKTKYEHLFDYASSIIGVSNDIIATLERKGAPKHKLVYLPCMFDLQRFEYADHSKNQFRFLAVGRFSETKSPHLTLLAFNEVLKIIPNAQLIFIGKDGGGELFESCIILAKALKIDHKIEFKGICTPEEVQNEMKKARVFVQHSLTTPLNGDKEGTPVAIMEAMASGLPVVSTKHAGILDLIESGTTGFLVDEYDYMNMAKKMIELIQSDELVASIGLNASESIRSNSLLFQNKAYFLEQVNNCMLKK
jgi:glycosyltransferase involved in cell wall biosynthesis